MEISSKFPIQIIEIVRNTLIGVENYEDRAYITRKYVGAPWFKSDATAENFKVAHNLMNIMFVNKMFEKTASAIAGQLHRFIILGPVSKKSQTVVKKRT
jgi:hypothetical protein